MTKTIEEAAKAYVESTDTWSYGCEENHDITKQMHESFKAGANYVYGLPLSSRMTAEEKERVRKAYKAMSDYGKSKGVECASCANYAARVWMQRIFGKELFKEGE